MSFAFTLLAFAPSQPLPVAPEPREKLVWKTELTLKHTRPIVAVAASDDRIATADNGGVVILWDARSGKEVQTLVDEKAKAAPVTRLQFSPNGELLYFVTHGQKRLSVCECRKPRQTQLFASYTCKGAWTVLGIGQETPRWILTPNNKSLHLHRTATDDQAPIGDLDQVFFSRRIDHRDRISHLAATDSVIVTIAGGVLHGWPADVNAKPWTVTLLGIEPTSLAISSNGEWIAVTGDEGEVRVCNAANGQAVSRLRGHKSAVWYAAFSPDAKQLATASEDATVRVWNVRTGAELSVLKGHTSGVTAVAFTPNGKRIVTASDDKTVKLWEYRK